MDHTAGTVRALIAAQRYGHANELELQTGIEEVLNGAGLEPLREVRLTPHDRIDFLVSLPDVQLGIEVKIAGQNGDVRRQLTRYAASGRVHELLLVTTLARHRAGLPEVLSWTPVHVLVLPGGLC